ncbi:hypothetical protein Gohar_012748 [Gossypium harknessii]|uniref:Uncharacterized protein n=1 Tax=Gossypium harknessii TaxID=34285 RepID=A0A7J9GY72_9ROSI|nr:hypothetical protein [Gossypium harknessii]
MYSHITEVSHQKLLMHAEETAKIQLNNAEKRIKAVREASFLFLFILALAFPQFRHMCNPHITLGTHFPNAWFWKYGDTVTKPWRSARERMLQLKHLIAECLNGAGYGVSFFIFHAIPPLLFLCPTIRCSV